MLQITPQMKVLVAVNAVDFRNGIDGLAALCQKMLAHDPFTGTVFVFRNRRATAIKVLVYDGQGFWLCQQSPARQDVFAGGLLPTIILRSRPYRSPRISWRYSSRPVIRAAPERLRIGGQSACASEALTHVRKLLLPPSREAWSIARQMDHTLCMDEHARHDTQDAHDHRRDGSAVGGTAGGRRVEYAP